MCDTHGICKHEISICHQKISLQHNYSFGTIVCEQCQL